MANSFLKPEVIVNQGLGLLQRELILPRLVTRYGAADFVGAKNDTINVKIPSLLAGRDYEWRTRNAAIQVDELNEQSIPVTLNKHPYSAVAITDEELTLDIKSWGEQVARPQIRAVAETLEGYIADAMAGATYSTADLDPGAFTDFHAMAVEARRRLNVANVPAAGRVIVLGSNLEADALNDEQLKKVNESGNGDVLREAVIGRVAGFTVIGNVNSIDPDVGYAFHPSAFAFANVAPVVPAGVPAGAAGVFEGLAMRWIRDYDTAYLRDRSVYSAFAGAASVADERVMDPNDPDFGDLTNKNSRAVKISAGSSS